MPHATLIALLPALATVPFAQSPTPFAGEQIPFGNGAADLLRVDFNHDGRPDLIARVANFQGANGVVLRLGDGAGGFGPQIHLPAPKSTRSFGCADMNNDGDLDVVACQDDNFDPAVAVWLGNGDGTFASVPGSLTGQRMRNLDLADINGDGKVDLAQSDESLFATISVLSGDGAGGFALPTQFGVGVPCKWVDLADFDGDGDADLTAGANSVSEVVFARNTSGVLSFSGSVTVSVPPGQLRSFDADLDGDTDVMLGAGGGTAVHLLRLNGALPPLPQGLVTIPTSDAIPERFALGDLNGDARLDVVAAHTGASTAAVVLSTGPAAYGPPTLVPAVNLPLGIVLGDWDGDGLADLATAGGQSGTLQARRGLGGGAFESSAPLLHAASGTLPMGLAVGELDGDGRLDAVVGSYVAKQIAVLHGTGGGAFGPAALHSTGATVTGVAFADIDQDGQSDVLVANESGGPQLNQVALLRNAGGILGAPTFAPTGMFPYAIVSGDFSGDGITDALTANIGVATVSLLAGDGAGGFGPAQHAPTDCLARCAAAADLDLDGLLDVVVRGQGNNDLVVLRGAPGGGLQAAVAYPVPEMINQSGGVAVGDLDGNGWPDLATNTGGGFSAGIAILFGQGGGVLAAGSAPAVVGRPVGVAIGDVDGDGAADLVANQLESTIAWFRGTGSGTFEPVRLFQGAFGAEEIVLADVDADGRLDALATCGTQLVVQRNLLAAPAGISAYGTGTSGCLGAIGMGASSAPKLGNGSFALIATNAPPQGLGLGAFAAVPDFAGSSALLPGLVLHVDPLAGPYALFALQSSVAGVGRKVLPVPNDAQLLGASVHAQTYWLELPPLGCTSASLPFASSRGLSIAFQP
ncbi:MAG: VCBS repeat-containing protein [Planctomycetes bacterium]|nr:VCBS repeat-containing protein [Planctomycetota bacterium]